MPSSAALSACSHRAPKLPVREGMDDFCAVSARFGPAEPGKCGGGGGEPLHTNNPQFSFAFMVLLLFPQWIRAFPMSVSMIWLV